VNLSDKDSIPMISWKRTTSVHASARVAFDVIGTNVAVNHPKWEKEVESIRLLTPGPIGAGTRAVMVRKEMGRIRESQYEVSEFVPGRCIAFDHPQDALDFKLRFEVVATGPTECELTVEVAADPKGTLRLMQPIMRLAFPRRSRRITDAMIAVIETTARTESAEAQPTHQLEGRSR
jgi:hypothetical protein